MSHPSTTDRSTNASNGRKHDESEDHLNEDDAVTTSASRARVSATEEEKAQPDDSAPTQEFRIRFPAPRETAERVVVTLQMTGAANRTMALHEGSPLVVWTGPSRNGKTVTAKWLAKSINDAAERDPHGFRAALFEYGGASGASGNDMKRVMRSVYHAVIAKLDEGLYRQLPSEALALHVVNGLRAKNIQMLMVDEAGLLGVEGLRGLVTIRDVAEHNEWPLSIVLIGMDNLPADIHKLPQILRRVHDWYCFEPYSVEDTYELLVGLEPQFVSFSPKTPEGRRIIALIQSICGGLPGLLAPFLRKLQFNQKHLGEPLTESLIRVTQIMTKKDMDRAVRAGTGVVDLHSKDARSA
ncbi:MAG: ATP-binding protein [Gemmatimonadaceae bacterium]